MRMYRARRRSVCLCAAAFATWTLGFTASLPAQSTLDWPLRDFVQRTLDTGVMENAQDEPAVVYDAVVSVESSAWLRLYFASADLEPGSFIRTTSLLDGEFQELDAASLSMWHNTTAYFNGDSVRLEVIAGPHTVQNRLVLDRVAVYMLGGGPRSCGVDGCGYCGADDRVPSTELWSGRLMPVGCTGSVYNQQSCVVSAGHCAAGGDDDVIQFNVPNSAADCYPYNPPVADQFPITNHQFVSNGVGDDWSVMLTGTNGSGQRPYDRYGVYRPIATALANAGDTVSVWGYGVDDSPSPTRSQTQQTSSGTIGSRQSTYYTYSVDVTYGNSGSGLLKSNEIVGIVTHCSYDCANIATRVDLAAFAAARDQLCPPTNDYCASALLIYDGAYSSTTVGATQDGTAGCGSSSSTADVWYQYIPLGSGTLTVGTCTASYNTVLSVHTGCPGTSGNQIGCNDNSTTCGAGSTRSYLAVSVTGGATYYIRVSGNSGATGTFTLTVVGPADTMPPTPNPMTFATAPTPNGVTPTTAIDMVASVASDPTTPIKYAFDANTGPAYPGAGSRGWGAGRTYSDADLTPNTTYVYRAKARDGLLNETSPSADGSATTYIETPAGVSFGTVTSNSIELNATGTLTNLTVGTSGAYFDSTTPGGDGGINAWVQVSTDQATGLSPDTSYTFQVKARNRNSVETLYSPTANKVTLANVPAAPTLGGATTSTMTLDVNANGNPSTTTFAIRCTATNPADANWTNKYVSAAGTPSAAAVWQTDATWGVVTVSGLQPATTYTFAVKARNQENVETAFGPGASLATSGGQLSGACCYPVALCAIVTQAVCESGGGVYQGNNTTCTVHVCCPLMGDMNGDTYVDGADIQGFVDAMLAGFAPCADLATPYNVLDEADVSAFVTLLLGS